MISKTIQIIRATVVITSHGTDVCMLRVNSPDPLPKVSSEGLFLEFKAEKGTGAEYIRKNFGIEPLVLNG